MRLRILRAVFYVQMSGWPTGLEAAPFSRATIRSSVVRRGPYRYTIALFKAIIADPRILIVCQQPSNVVLITVKITVNDCAVSLGRGKESRRADLRTAHLLQLRVIHQALRGFAEGCKSRISRQLSLLRVAARCTVLRSRWCQNGVK